MKKYIAVLLSVMMILILAGCSENDTDFTEDADNAADVSVNEENDASKDADPEDDADSEDEDTDDIRITDYLNETTVGEYTILTWSAYDCEPLIIVENNTTFKCGAVDSTGEFVIPCEYNDISKAGEERYIVYNGGYGIVDLNGKEIVPCEYKDLECDYSSGDEAALVRKDEGGLYGYISIIDGKTIVEPKFKEALGFNGTDLAPAKFDNGKWGYINRKGETVIDPQYEEAWEFGQVSESTDDNNVARVRIKNGEEKEGVIDKTGKLVIPCEYDWVCDYKEGLAVVNNSDFEGDGDDYDAYGVVDGKGKEIIPLENNREIDFSIKEDLIRVCTLDSDGVISDIKYYDMKGKETSVEKYDDIESLFYEPQPEESYYDNKVYEELKNSRQYSDVDWLYSGNFIVKKDADGLWAITDKNGREVTDFIFNTEMGRD